MTGAKSNILVLHTEITPFRGNNVEITEIFPEYVVSNFYIPGDDMLATSKTDYISSHARWLSRAHALKALMSRQAA